MLRWLEDMVLCFYGVEEEFPGEPEFVVPLCYGLTSREEDANLPNIELSCLSRAITESKQCYPCTPRIVFANADYFRKEREEELKRRFIANSNFRGEVIVPEEGVRNTITEAKALAREMNIFLGRRPIEIILVAERFHAPRALYVWKQVLPNTRIVISTVSVESQKDSPIIFFRHSFIWLITNVFLYSLLKIGFGEILSSFRSPLWK